MIAERAAAAVVDTGQARYEIVVAPGLLDSIGHRLAELQLAGRVFVIGDQTAQDLYGEAAARSLVAAGFTVSHVSFPAGEASKTLATADRVFDRLLAERVERRDTVLALGGGVSGDLAGFVSATVLRGINLVHAPTTTLAMLDSSIGGKTGVDHPAGKNMIGAFHQPRAVFCDIDTLRTLPERHYLAGLAEVIKHGLILDADLFDLLEARVDRIRAADQETLTEVIGWSARIKAGVVSQDERESGLRTLLNYGHTTGHAIEAVQGYTGLLHGEAIAIGMAVAGAIAVRRGLLGQSAVDRQNAVLGAYGLPVRLPAVDRARLLHAMAGDKKATAGRIRWVLLERVGQAVTSNEVADEDVLAALEACS